MWFQNLIDRTRAASWVSYPPSWVSCPPSWVSYPPSWVSCPPSWVACPPSWVSYLPSTLSSFLSCLNNDCDPPLLKLLDTSVNFDINDYNIFNIPHLAALVLYVIPKYCLEKKHFSSQYSPQYSSHIIFCSINIIPFQNKYSLHSKFLLPLCNMLLIQHSHLSTFS